MRPGYPIVLDVSKRLVVIVGGGTVAARKVQGLLAGGARRVRVVAPRINDSVPSEVERIIDGYHERHLDGAGLVFAATDDPDINSRVVHDASRRAILVNRADDDPAQSGDFTTPAVRRDGALLLAVSAGSAAVSAAIRDELATRLDGRWVLLAEAVRVLRPRVTSIKSLSLQRRAEVLRDLVDESAREAASDGVEAVWAWLVSRHAELRE